MFDNSGSENLEDSRNLDTLGKYYSEGIQSEAAHGSAKHNAISPRDQINAGPTNS